MRRIASVRSIIDWRQQLECMWRGKWRKSSVELLLVVVFSSVILNNCRASPNPPECRPPCNNARCAEVNVSQCINGTYHTCNGCCTVCAVGLNGICTENPEALFGLCGTGLRCYITEFHGFGICLRDPNAGPVTSPSPSPPAPPLPPSPSPPATATPPSPSSPASATPSLPPSPSSPTLSTPSAETTALPAPSPSLPSEETTEEEESVCRHQPCSMDYCSERETRKKRICSAAGLSPVVPERNKCQLTTCRACFLLLEPDCYNITCKDPPMKNCLHQYFECVRRFYFDPSSAEHLIKLEDPTAWTARGRVVCFVPSVMEGNSSSFNSTSGSSDEDDSHNNSTY